MGGIARGCAAGRAALGGGSRQFALPPQVPDNGTSDWPRDGESGLMPDRDAKLGGHRLGVSKRFGGIPEVRHGGAQ